MSLESFRKKYGIPTDRKYTDDDFDGKKNYQQSIDTNPNVTRGSYEPPKPTGMTKETYGTNYQNRLDTLNRYIGNTDALLRDALAENEQMARYTTGNAALGDIDLDEARNAYTRNQALIDRLYGEKDSYQQEIAALQKANGRITYISAADELMGGKLLNGKDIYALTNDQLEQEYTNARERLVKELNVRADTAEDIQRNKRPEEIPGVTTFGGTTVALGDEQQISDLNQYGKDTTADILREAAKFADREYKDTFLGQASANYNAGRISQNKSLAWNDYLDVPSDANRKKAEAYDQIETFFTAANTEAMDEYGQILPDLTKDYAQYLPQAVDQTKYKLQYGIPGAAIGTVMGNIGQGYEVGAATGSAVYSFKTMRGSAFKSLLDLGVDEETARKAATAEAMVSSVIEFGDTILDFFTTGADALLSKVGLSSTPIQSILSEWASDSATKQALLLLGGYAANVLSEGFEEATQESVSIANEERALQGESDIGGLVKDAAGKYISSFNPDDPNSQRVAEARRGGRLIAAIGGGAQIAANTALGAVADDIALRSEIRSEEQAYTNALDQAFNAYTGNAYSDPENVAALVEEAKEVGVNSDTLKAVERKIETGKSVTTEEVRQLVQESEHAQPFDGGLTKQNTTASQEQRETAFGNINSAPTSSQEKTPVASQENAKADIATEAKKYGKQEQAFRSNFIAGQDVKQYSDAFRTAYERGLSGVPYSVVENLDSLRYLTDSQRENAYRIGQDAARTRDQQIADSYFRKPTGKTAKHFAGTVSVQGMTAAELRIAMNDTQNKQVNAIRRIAEATGVNVVFYRSAPDESGQYHAEEGRFNWNENTIYVDVNSGLKDVGNAGNMANYTVLRTFTHEFTHFMEKYNAVKYGELRKLVFAELQRQLDEENAGSDVKPSVDDIITQKMNAYRAQIDKNFSYERASREVVADAMTDILRDSTFVQNLHEQNNELFHEILHRLKQFISEIKSAFKTMRGNTDKPEAILLQQKDANGEMRYLQSIIDKFDEVAKGAVENYQNAMQEQTEEQTEVAENATMSEPVEDMTQYSIRSLAQAGGFKAEQLEDGTVILSRNGSRVSEVTVADIDRSPIGSLINHSFDSGYISDSDSKSQKKLFADLLTMAAKSNDFVMSMQFAGSEIFTAIKSNSDKQYNTTYDFPSICTKTQAVIDAMSAAMKEKKGGLTKDEIEHIYQKVNYDGNPVPCPECYVFSRWIGIGSLLDNIWTYQNKFSKMSKGEVQAEYLAMSEEIQRVADENGLTFGRAKGSLATKFTKRYNELRERVEKAVNQGEKPSEKDVVEMSIYSQNATLVKSMTWIDTVYFKDSSHKTVNKDFFVSPDVLFDLNRGEEFASKFKQAWAFRTTQGAGYGKAITPYAEAVLGEGIIGTNSIDNLQKNKKAGTLDNIFLKQNGTLDAKAKKALETATKKMNNQAFLGGQRFQSTSDARFENAFDYLIAALEVQAMHGMVQVYTKVPGAVPTFAAWGFSTNQSLMPKGGGLDANGKPIDTSVGGMNPRIAQKNRRDFDTQGTITIGVNDNHIRAMMDQVWRDFIIPYHASGGDAMLVASFRRIQDNGNVDTVRSTDYTRTQSDKVLSDEVLRNYYGKTDEEIELIHARRKARNDIFGMNRSGKKSTKPDMEIVRGSRFLSALYDKLSAGGEWDGVTEPTSIIGSQIFPNEYWDQSVSYEQSGKITEDYLAYCEELGFLHRFSGMVPSNGTLIRASGYDQNGNKVKLTDLSHNPDGSINKFFWKVLTDRRMYDNDGNYLPQRRVSLATTQKEDLADFATTNRYGKDAGRQYDPELSRRTANEIAAEFSTSQEEPSQETETYGGGNMDEAAEEQFSIRTKDGNVYRGINIDDSDFAYSESIKNREKLGETRENRVPFLDNAAKTGERIALVRSGAGNYKAYATAKIGTPEFISASEWESRRADTRVPPGSKYDLKDGKDGKWYYPFVDLEVLDKEVKPTTHSPVIARFDDAVQAINEVNPDLSSDTTQFSLRSSDLSDREVLRQAAKEMQESKTFQFNEAEREALRIFQNRLNTLDKLTGQKEQLLEQLKPIKAQISELNGKYKIDIPDDAPFLSKSDIKIQIKEPLSSIEFSALVARVQDLVEQRRKLSQNLKTVNDKIRGINDSLLKIEQQEIIHRILRNARKVLEKDARSRAMENLREYKASQLENSSAKKHRDSIVKTAYELSKWLEVNSDKQHVPELLKTPLTELLESIDMSSNRLLKGGKPTRADERFRANLSALELAMERQQAVLDGEQTETDSAGAYLDLSDENRQFLHEMNHIIAGVNGVFTLNSMNAEQLEAFDKLLKNLKTAIAKSNQALANARYKNIPDMATDFIRHVETLGEAGKAETGRAANFLQWKNATPFYAFKRFGASGEALFDGLTRGWERLANNAREVIDFSEATWNPKDAAAWQKEIHEVELESGDTIRMTTAQIMELSQLYGRPQARGHIDVGGIRVGNIEGQQNTKTYHLTEADLAKIIGTLTKDQYDTAVKIRKFMATQGAKWGNEISMARFGYNFYTEGESYYPIVTIDTERKMRDSDIQKNSIFRLLNASFTKPLKPKAKNALVVGDIFTTFAQHMNDSAKLNALGLPILDAIKWFNWSEAVRGNISDTFNVIGTRKAMERAFGKNAEHYFQQLLMDINGPDGAKDRSGAVKKAMTSAYKAAAVGANLRVALLQPTSYVRAQYTISAKSLLEAMKFSPRSVTNAYNEALANSGTAVWKNLGYYDTDISKSLYAKILNSDNSRDKIVEMSMELAEIGDRRTWGRLWIACKLEAKAQNPNLDGKALLTATSDIFRKTIYATQVMDSTLTRSELMRGTSIADRAVSAFGAEPTLSANILMDAASRFSEDKKRYGAKESFRRNEKLIAMSVITYMSSALASALVESIADAARDDDDYETFLQKWKQAFFGENSFIDGNLAQDLTILGKIPEVKDIVSMLRGRTTSDMGNVAVKTLVDTYQIWRETIKLANGTLEKPTKTTYYGNMTTWGKIYKTLQSLSQLTGVAVGNAARDITAVWNTIIAPFTGLSRIKTYDAGTKSAITSAYANGFISFEDASAELVRTGEAKDANDAYFILQDGSKYNALYNAIDADSTADFSDALEDLIQHGVKEKNARSAVASHIGDQYRGGKISRAEALTQLTKYGGKTIAEAEAAVNEWTYKLDTGYNYSDLRSRYDDGQITYADAVNAMVKYGGKDRSDAEKTADRWEFIGGNSQYDDITEAAVSKYNQFCKPAGISKAQFFKAWDAANDIKGADKDGDGKNDVTAAENKLSYIGKMPLSSKQKTELAKALGIAESTITGKAPW